RTRLNEFWPVCALARFPAAISSGEMLREGVTTISCRQFVALCSTAQPHVMHRDIRRLWVEIAQPVPLGTANAAGPTKIMPLQIVCISYAPRAKVVLT